MDPSLFHVCIVLFLLNFTSSIVTSQNTDYSIPYVTIEDCLKDDSGQHHEFFDLSSLECVDCSQNSTYQVQSFDGLSCVCRESYRKVYHEVDLGVGERRTWICQPCADDQVASLDEWECVACDTEVPTEEDMCPDCTVGRDLTAERTLTGWFLEHGGEDTRTCVECLNETLPDEDGHRCQRCNQHLTVLSDCECPGDQLSGGVCFEEPADIVPQQQLDFNIQYNQEIESEFLKVHLQAAHGACVDHTQKTTVEKEGYSNLTSCQLLANACVMTLYDTTSTTNIYNPCSLHLGLVDGRQGPPTSDFPSHQQGQHNINNWRKNMPWLYYAPDNADSILGDNIIPTEYYPSASLNFTVAAYSAEGDFVGFMETHGGLIQLCKDDKRNMDAAYEFGTNYRKKCSVAAEDLFDSKEFHEYFYDMYLEDNTEGQQLYPVPLLVTNYKSSSGRGVNTGDDRADWELTRRFFIVERTGGKADSDEDLQAVRYAESMTLNIELQESSGRGKIRPPYLEITYATATRDDYVNRRKKEISFEVVYTMPLERHYQDLPIAMGVMSAFALLYAGYVTMNANRRDGKLAIDFVTLFKFLFYLSGSLANVFFVVIYGFTLWWFIMYKEQSTMFLIPDSGAIYHVEAYIGAAFALKALQLMFIVGLQVTVDIFFVDWERPAKDVLSAAMAAMPSAHQRQRVAEQGGPLPQSVKGEIKDQPPVSIWRTYFVANEWNELQTVRRIKPMVLLSLVVVVLYSVGVENWARFDPSASVTAGQFEGRGEYTKLFRFPVMVSMYLAVALAMWLFNLLIWSRFKEDAMGNFVDLCSMCNVSVFVLSHENYGYYIHGRSPHGKSDFGLTDMYKNMKKEEADLCSERGLQGGSDIQTFEVTIPRKFRSEYNKVLFKVTMRRQEAGQVQSGQSTSVSNGTELDEDVKAKLQAYKVLNRFVQAFIDHNTRKMAYTVLEKTKLERILDTEFIRDEDDVGHFYYDRRNAFTQSLFYGQEFTLQIFTILLFAVMDLAFQDYVLAAVITYIIDALLVYTRQALGSINISKKTMVDPRFLI